MSAFKLSRWAGLAVGIAGALGVALPSVAFADSDAMFQAMDANGDGKISPDEHATAAGRMFEQMDANGDGKVTVTEMAVSHQKMTGRKPEKGDVTAVEKIKMMDTNGDNVLSVEEYAAGSHYIFEAMDTDHDGYVTKAELKAGHQKFLHHQKGQTAPSGSSRPAD